MPLIAKWWNSNFVLMWQTTYTRKCALRRVHPIWVRRKRKNVWKSKNLDNIEKHWRFCFNIFKKNKNIYIYIYIYMKISKKMKIWKSWKKSWKCLKIWKSRKKWKSENLEFFFTFFEKMKIWKSWTKSWKLFSDFVFNIFWNKSEKNREQK